MKWLYKLFGCISEDGIPRFNGYAPKGALQLQDDEFEAVYKAMKKGKSDKWIHDRMPWLFKEQLEAVRCVIKKTNKTKKVIKELRYEK